MDTRRFKKNAHIYEAMDCIDEFLDSNDQDTKIVFYGKIAEMVNADDPVLIIDNYIVREMFGDKNYTKNAAETYQLILECHDKFYS